jgi:microsomal dipeptidase-like Zn-dependent dipeptidase
MQATTLGRYLLYRPDGTFLAAQEDGSVAPAAEPSPAADWRVRRAGPRGLFRLDPQSGKGPILSVRFVRAKRCAVFPEAALDAKGKPKRGSTPFGRVGGLVEGHMHWMTFEYFGRRFHCGRPWHPYGIRYALPDCSSVEGPQGTAAPFQNFLNYGNPSQPHDTSGYPQLTEWRAGNLTYEGTYWRWIQRAWLGGMRLMVMGINENRVLCELQEERETSCNEMDTVRRGIKSIRQLQRYVDAQAGGPGKGFFKIVTNPFDARRVINQGRMAVVLEIEISEPFDCRGWEQPSCDQAQVDRQLDEVHRLGVRSMLLLNKFDNPLTGVRFDSGPVGVVINNGNKTSAGSYWDARTCTGPLADNEIFQPDPQFGAAINTLLVSAGLPPSTAPAYPPAPHCNTRGLTDLGSHVVRRMMDLRMVVNPDHMSQAGVDQTLKLLEARRHSGVISPHGWMDPGNWPRLWKLGGLAFPGHSTSDEYVKEWKRYRPRQTPREFDWGYGADLGGLSHQPEASAAGAKFRYPFKSYDGRVTFKRQRTGERTFDYGKEGVAHYGLYADWFRDLGRVGGKRLARDMWDGAEAYLAMWERAEGVRRAAAPLRPGHSGRAGAADCGSAQDGARYCAAPASRSSACARGAGACAARGTCALPMWRCSRRRARSSSWGARRSDAAPAACAWATACGPAGARCASAARVDGTRPRPSPR